MWASTHLHLLWLLSLAQVLAIPRHASAQTLGKRDQGFTRGFAILDSPASNSQMHAGSSFSIAVDVSADGKLSQPEFTSSGIDSLNISLISSQTSFNLTVVTSPAFLQQEPGSTVKHYNLPIPSCVPPGDYNLTMYELSHIGGSQYFSISPFPITVVNEAQSGQCAGLNELLDQPQLDSPPPQ
ncbi:hypothetical protein BC835DRAFT_1261658, partial [Cytidiella melzeri]